MSRTSVINCVRLRYDRFKSSHPDLFVPSYHNVAQRKPKKQQPLTRIPPMTTIRYPRARLGNSGPNLAQNQHSLGGCDEVRHGHLGPCRLTMHGLDVAIVPQGASVQASKLVSARVGKSRRRNILERWINTIQCMDCVEAMRRLLKETMDLILTWTESRNRSIPELLGVAGG